MTVLYNKWLHRFAVAVAACTLFLIFVGGMVTSTDSGLAVPDWPLSYGRLMPPMIGGIFYEHGHRMVATAVGFLTIILAVLIKRVDSRRWIKKAGWLALALVIVQGLFGGMTVLLRLPAAVSIVHACLAQTFFSLVVAIAVWTSRSWLKEKEARTEAKNVIPLHHLAIGFFIACYAQLIFGAVLRHTGWGLTLHIAGAIVVLTLASWAFLRSRKASGGVRVFSSLLFALVNMQVILGVTTYLILGHEFDVIPVPVYATATISMHVALGALILGLSVVLALLAFRSRPDQNPPLKTRLSDYFELTKPGITMTAGITALAGFVLGSKGHVDLLQLLHTGIGTLLISAGACTLNMVIEKDIDAKMKRTRKRPLPAGRLQAGEALFLGVFLSVAATLYLSWAVNLLTAFVAGLTLSVYLYVYTPLKKISSLCTTVGAVAGALPPVIGWTAATGQLGIESLVLFGILFFWQFPHFFSLAWLYKEDYEQAGLHMLPRIQDNGTTTAVSVVVNSVLLLLVSLLPTVMNLTGWFYLFTALGLGLWLTVASVFFFQDRSYQKARRLFFASLAYVPVLVIALVLNKIP